MTINFAEIAVELKLAANSAHSEYAEIEHFVAKLAAGGAPFEECERLGNIFAVHVAALAAAHEIIRALVPHETTIRAIMGAADDMVTQRNGFSGRADSAGQDTGFRAAAGSAA